VNFGRFWLVLPRPWPRIPRPEWARFPDGTWFFRWGGLYFGAWGSEAWKRQQAAKIFKR
jgi:hypothetical protein